MAVVGRRSTLKDKLSCVNGLRLRSSISGVSSTL